MNTLNTPAIESANKVAELVREYKADPNCHPALWISSEDVTPNEKNQFIALALNGAYGNVNFRLWDDKEKALVNSVNYNSIEWAEREKLNFLSEGNYPGEPHSVIAINLFIDNVFITQVA